MRGKHRKIFKFTHLRLVFVGTLFLCALYAIFSAYYLYRYFKVDIEQSKILTAQEKTLAELPAVAPPKGKYDIKFGILMYHHITNDPNHRNSSLAVRPEVLEQQISYLLEKGYVFLTLSQALDNFNAGLSFNKTLVLTFDDGYRDFYEQAYPILKKYNVPATLFVINTDIGRAGNVTVEMMKEMRASGLIEIGAHTLNHPNLTKLKEEAVRKQIFESKLDLQKKLGVEVRVLAYPYGFYNKTALDLVKEAGYAGAVSVFFGEKPNQNNRYVWRRVMITNNESGDKLLKLIYLAFNAAK